MLSRKYFFMLMTVGFFLLVFVTDVIGENLVEFFNDTNGDLFYYDKDSIISSSTKLKVDVWIVCFYGEKHRDKLIKIFKLQSPSNKNYDDLLFGKGMLEINCLKEKSHFLTYTDYDKDGNVLYINNYSTEWEDITNGSIWDVIKNIVCKS